MMKLLLFILLLFLALLALMVAGVYFGTRALLHWLDRKLNTPDTSSTKR